MKRCLVLAAALSACLVSVVAADVNVLPAESYNATLQTSGWSPSYKAYTLTNTSYDWVCWQGNAGAVAVCEPGAGWIAPGASINIRICPATGMEAADPGTYLDQVTLDFVPRIAGDVDGDGAVNAVDLLRLAQSWNTATGAAGYDALCDFNADGRIDVLDLLTLARTFGQTYGAVSM